MARGEASISLRSTIFSQVELWGMGYEYEGPRIETGEVYLTASGAWTSEVPRIDLTTPRKTINTLKRVDLWLWENARDEAARRGLIFYEDEPKGHPDRWPQACRDACNLILWG